ncbi:cell wall metabolism sensor histidine kinase WalK [Streptomyces sp. YS415]|uniref:sensor histidine kinase n=1 Tax=Streptomyces sp. YS415 TaxID=2944806 RepID=UPI002021EA65|nr:HAMP domain-containing sensor histidine kinase [Streptomyces sp. YS415]MCL7430321.1 HAMP domain-containing histidine kinase [Streptomyces sp. YS415]
MLTSVLIAACSTGATAWLAVQTTTRAIEKEHGQVLADDATVYDRLLEYAATHPDWTSVEPVVRDLSRRTGRRIALGFEGARPFADSAAPPAAALPRPAAVIDPLHVGTGLRPADTALTGSDTIDARATGPYRLTPAERAELRRHTDKRVACLRGYGLRAERVDHPSGRPSVFLGSANVNMPAFDPCFLALEPTATERRPLAQLNALVAACLEQRIPDLSIESEYAVEIRPGFSWSTKLPEARVPVIEQCIAEQRRAQLRPYVAPAAHLYLGTSGRTEAARFHLTTQNAVRVAAVTGLVLLLTVGVTAVLAHRLIRPLRALTDAAHDPSGDQPRVRVRTQDEIGHLTQAFNDLSERRARMEEQRKVMVSDVAHELRTPLTNIRSWLEATEDGITTASPALVSSLLEEALLLQHIIDDLQDLAAADAEKLTLHPEAVRLGDVLQHVTAAHRAAADAAGVALSAGGERDILLLADPVRLRQAVGNLVSNAVRHTGPGGSVRLTARTYGAEVFVEVADTGSGIEPDDIPRLFERFWRAEKSRTRHAGGSGLGLAIALQLARAHGGTITVTSTLGVGSVFTLRLPASAVLPRAAQ